jgi:DNA-binding NarL/FixJ family response regulator
MVSDPSTDELARLRAVATAAFSWNRAGQLDRSLCMLEEMLATALQRVDDLPDAPHWVGGTLVITQILAGYLDEAEALLDWGRQKAAAGEVYDAHQLSSLARGRIALIRGDATAAVRLLSSAVSAPTALISLEEAWAWALLAEARALRGDSRGADEAMTLSDSARHRGSARYAADIERSRIWVAAARGEMRRAAELAREAAAFARDDRDRPIELWAWHDLARLGYEAEACEPLQELAKKVASRWAPLFDSHCRALVGRDPDELLRCADDFESIGAMLLAAEAAAEAAAALSRAGSRRWTFAAARAERLKGRCPGTLTPALRGAPAVARLSKRQREVALLASLGLSSPEIAQRLFLSTRTVESHLQSAYERLGVANRSELAAVLHAAPITDTRGYEEPRHTDQPC